VEETPVAAPEPSTAASEKAGKKKKLPAHLAMIQKQQEELRKRMDDEARLAAEEQAKLEEEEKRSAEETKRREEQKALKKQKEKERIEQLKKEGKYMTKAQKEEKARNERKLQQMMAAGIKVGGLEGDGEGQDKKPKKVVYDSRKKGNKMQEKV